MLVSIRLSDTYVGTVNSASQAFTQVRPNNAVIVWAASAICLAIGKTATVNDFRLSAATYMTIALTEAETLNYICATAEPDGEIRITHVLT